MALAKHHDFIDHPLLVEIFGFLPNYITDDLYDAMNFCLYNIAEGFSTRFTTLCPEKELEISEAIRNFERQMEEELDRSFNMFQEYMFKNVLRIPEKLDIKPNYLKDIQLNLTKEHEDLLDMHLVQIRQEIISQRKMQHFLNEKVQHLEHELNSMDEYSQILSFLSEIPKKHKVMDVEFTMECLRTNLNDLKTAIIVTIPKLREKFHDLEPEKRTLDLRSSIRAQINSKLGQKQD